MNTNKTSAAKWVHSFTLAGLGEAPFHFVAMTEAKYQAAPGEPIRAGSSCDRCGASIMYVYHVRSADGIDSKVGCDCVRRTGDTELSQACSAGRRAYEREARERLSRAERDARKAEHLAWLAGTAERNSRNCAMILEGCQVILGARSSSDYQIKIADRVYNELTEGVREGVTAHEWEILARAYSAAILPDPERHVGAIGEKVERLVRFEGGPIVGLDSQFGPSLMAQLRVVEGPDAGQVLIWKTSTYRRERRPGERDDKADLFILDQKEGTEFTIAGTVKSTSTYKNVAQTWIQRCKIAVPPISAADKKRIAAERKAEREAEKVRIEAEVEAERAAGTRW